MAVIFCGVIAAFVIGEMALRWLLFSPVPIRWNIGNNLRNPSLYGHFLNDSDFWLLYQKWVGKKLPKADRIHPTLGWSQSKWSSDNPLGLLPDALVAFNSKRKRAFFLGDSFVKGGGDADHQLPKLLAKHLRSPAVVDLGNGGHGLDQIYLMFELARKLSRPSLVIAGVYLRDLDRSILRSRTYQKPYFNLVNDDLVLSNDVIDPDPAHYVTHSVPDIPSYLWRLLYRRFGFRIWIDLWRRSERLDLKRKVNSILLKKMMASIQSSGAPSLFVIFYNPEGISDTIWQETFLKSELKSMRALYFDTKEVITRYLQTPGTRISDLYVEDGHHNNLGNTLIAEGLYHFLVTEGLANVLD